MLHHVRIMILYFNIDIAIYFHCALFCFRLIRHYVEEDDAASVITSEEGNHIMQL